MSKFVKGLHSEDLFQKIKSSWDNNELLIVYPAHMNDLPNLDHINFPKDIILGLFTSGTTSGIPRLIFYTKRNIISSLEAIRKYFETEKIKNIFCYPQPNHVFGLVLGYLHSILYNIPLNYFPGPYSKSTHEAWLDTVCEGTLTLGTPVHFYDLIDYVISKSDKPTSSYTCIMGGATVSTHLWHQVQKDLNILAPSIGYGASEASPGISHLPPGVPPAHDGDVGFLLDGVTIHQITETGYSFSGLNQCTAVLNNGHLEYPQEIFIKDQLRFSDSTPTRLTMMGRSDLLINRGGAKYFPEIIESFLTQHSISSVVVPIYSERLGEDIAILVSESNAVDNDVIRELIVQRFGLKISTGYIVTGPIPLTTNFKIDRHQALLQVLSKLSLSFPVSSKYLTPFMPHRDSAIWIDEVISTDEKTFTSLSTIRPDQMLSAMPIELVAQTFGYGQIAEKLKRKSAASELKNTLIAEVRDFRFPDLSGLKPSDQIKTVVHLERDLGPFKLLSGQIFHGEKLLTDLSIKVVSN